MNPTNIPWTDLTWNPTTGCTFGCEWCYARRVAERFGRVGIDQTDSLTVPVATLDFRPLLHPHRLDEPLRRKKPAVIFLGSMGDVFDPAIPDSFRDRIFATVAAAQQHTFVVLTKRAKEQRDYRRGLNLTRLLAHAPNRRAVLDGTVTGDSVFPNLVLGVSVTNQADADERIPLLLDTPAASRMVSVEPMLGPVDLHHGDWIPPRGGGPKCNIFEPWVTPGPSLDFVAVGGKTPGKPLHKQVDCNNCALMEWNGVNDICERIESCDENGPAFWLRSLRDQCLAAGVPFHYKHSGTNPPLDGVVYDAGVPR